MTDTTSERTGFFGKYFLFRLKSLRPRMVMSLIMSLLTFPLALGSALPVLDTLCDLVKEQNELEPSMLSNGLAILTFGLIAAAASLIILLFMLITAPSGSFVYYAKKECADMYGALPLTFSQRFWADFISGLGATLVPFIICSGASCAFVPVLCGKNDMLVELGFSNFDSAKLATAYFQVLLTVIIALIAAYAIATLITVCCGSGGISILFSFVAVGMVPALAAIFSNTLISHCAGVDMTEHCMSLLRALPPFGTLIADAVTLRPTPAEPLSLICALIFIAAVIIGAYFLAKRRKAERTGEQFVYNAAYHIITVLLLVGAFVLMANIVGSVHVSDQGLYIGVFIFLTAAPLLFFELGHYRSFKKMWRSGIKYAASLIGSIALYGVLVSTGGFGLQYSLPNAEDIDNVVLSTQDSFYNSLEARFDDPEQIKTVLDINYRIIDCEAGTNHTSYPHTTITYTLKGGGTLTRKYYTYDDMTDTLGPIFSENKPITLPILDKAEKGAAYINEISVPSEGIVFSSIPDSDVTKELIAAIKEDINSGAGGDYIGTMTFSWPTDIMSGANDPTNMYILDERISSALRALDSRFSFMIREGYTHTLDAVKKLDKDALQLESATITYANRYEYQSAEWEENGYNTDLSLDISSGSELSDDPDMQKLLGLIAFYPDVNAMTNGTRETDNKRYDGNTKIVVISSYNSINNFMYIPDEKQEEAMQLISSLYEKQQKLYEEMYS